MKAAFYAVALTGAIIVIAVTAVSLARSASKSAHCPTGEVHGFVAVRHDPAFVVGTIPGGFTGDPRYFKRRYNCLGRGVHVRRLDEGVFEVRFVGVRVETATATAISDEGISASYLPIYKDIVRVVLRGPLGGSDIASRRDVAFAVVVY